MILVDLGSNPVPASRVYSLEHFTKNYKLQFQIKQIDLMFFFFYLHHRYKSMLSNFSKRIL